MAVALTANVLRPIILVCLRNSPVTAPSQGLPRPSRRPPWLPGRLRLASGRNESYVTFGMCSPGSRSPHAWHSHLIVFLKGYPCLLDETGGRKSRELT